MLNLSTIFLVLNNDLFIRDNQWVEKAILPLQDNPKVSLVGLEGSPSSLRENGTGFYGKLKEYVDGAFIMGRTQDFRSFGLFDPIFSMFFCEDSDLSLRRRQQGSRLAWVNIAHEHLRSQTMNLVEPSYRSRIFEQNLNNFRRRWNTYLTNRQFTNRILVKINSLGIGDVLANTPIVEALRRTFPTSSIEVTTSCTDIFIGNPYLSELYQIQREYKKAYDMVIDAKFVASSYKSLVEQTEKNAAIKVNSYVPQIFLTKGELNRGAKIVEAVKDNEDDVVVGVSLQMERVSWQGRNYNIEYAQQVIKGLRLNGFKVIELGHNVMSTGEADLDLTDQLSLREFFSVVANLDIALCLDSLMFHVTQAFSVPTFVLFGATEPIARVMNWDSVFPITNGVPCVGCYQHKGPRVPDFNVCEIGNEACMMIDPKKIVDRFNMSKTDLLIENIKYLEKWNRRFQQ